MRPIRAYGGGKCSIHDCPQSLRSRGWCGHHYKTWLNHGDPLWEPAPRPVRECGFPGCGKELWSQEYCRPHFRQFQQGKELRPVRPWRKYVIDHHFFDVIDTEAKAYWLGFITADGCIVSHNDLTINLQAADAGHLEKLSVSLSSDYPVRPSGSGKSRGAIVRWHANSVPIVAALGALGVTPRKSLTAEPWDGPPSLMPHYWRGVIDGDGGLSLGPGRHSSSRGQWRIYLVGSWACVDAFAQWASDICGSHAQMRPHAHSRGIWTWMIGGNRMATLLARELYGNCSIFLDRKQALADVILSRNQDGLAA